MQAARLAFLHADDGFPQAPGMSKNSPGIHAHQNIFNWLTPEPVPFLQQADAGRTLPWYAPLKGAHENASVS